MERRRQPRDDDDTRAPLPAPDEGVGTDGLPVDRFRAMPNMFRALHLMMRLATRATEDRSAAIEEAVDALLVLSDPGDIPKVLSEMPKVFRIVDIYPLEVLKRLLERAPDALPRVRVGSIVKNRAEIESARHEAGMSIELRLALQVKIIAFALTGGHPGYCLAPGPPGAYELEIDRAGQFGVLLLGQTRDGRILEELVLNIDAKGL